MDDEQKRNLEAFLWIIGVVICLMLLGQALQGDQQNNQLVRANPAAPPPPVVPELPDLIAELSRSKSICEGHGSQCKEYARIGRMNDDQYAYARRLYDEAKAESDGCIDFLRSGLTRRFVAQDVPIAQQRIVGTLKKSDKFVDWVKRFEPPMVGALPPKDALEMINRWLESANSRNDAAIMQLRDDLERCRLKDWNAIN